MAANLYFIKCLTNLQVGNGDVNFNVIDNEVEKDPVTGYPTINPSGVKGALRQYFDENAPEFTARLFGSPVKDSLKDQTASTPGSLKILAASLLARPVRAENGGSAYHMVTTRTALQQLKDMVFSLTGSSIFELQGVQPNLDYRCDNAECDVEGYSVHMQLDLADKNNKAVFQYLKNYMGEDIVILSDETFRKMPLPVIARNYLENGESKNLWYEELVPHESVFWFMVIGEEKDVEAFHKAVDGKVVQFGGNASLGCGLCRVKQGGVWNV